MIILFQFRLEWGRFTTPDLLWSAFPSHTPYHYAYNSPLIFSDPSGLAPEKEKDSEELQGLFDWSAIEASIASVCRFIASIQNSKYDPLMTSVFAIDNNYNGNRTASENWEINGNSNKKRIYESLISLGWLKTLIDHDKNQLYVPTSMGYKIISFWLNASSALEYSQITSQLVETFDKMVKADPYFFDPIYGTDVILIIESGAEIAKDYNSRNGGNWAHLSGLHSPNTPMIGMTTIRIAKEVFSENRIPGYLYLKASFFDFILAGREKLTPMDVISHEFAHAIHYQSLGATVFSSLSDYEKERFAVETSNFFRGFYGFPLETLRGRGWKK